jgi:hypothetical protein
MAELLNFLADHCSIFFQPGRFRLVDSQTADHMGGFAVVVLESKVLRLRIAKERGELMLEFQPTRELPGKRRTWFSLGLWRGLLLGDRGGSEVLNPAWARFLAESLSKLQHRLNDPARSAGLLLDLRDQARQRAKRLFE